jgi:hypothetical protein
MAVDKIADSRSVLNLTGVSARRRLDLLADPVGAGAAADPLAVSAVRYRVSIRTTAGASSLKI